MKRQESSEGGHQKNPLANVDLMFPPRGIGAPGNGWLSDLGLLPPSLCIFLQSKGGITLGYL